MRAPMAALVVLVVLGILLAPPASAQSTVLHVNPAAGCTDAGTGTETAPFCTPQAAADVVEPGQIVRIRQDVTATVSITRSGTPDAPIVFEGASSSVRVRRPVDATGPTITVRGAHDVVVRSLSVNSVNGTVAVLVEDARRVTVDRLVLEANFQSGHSFLDGLRVAGNSADVMISRNTFRGGARAIHLEGGTRITAAGNVVHGYNPNDGVLVEDSQNFAFTGNTVLNGCLYGLGVTGASTGSVQNNILTTAWDRGNGRNCLLVHIPRYMQHALEVDAVAAPGVTVDYNILDGPGNDYLWSGTRYQDAYEFHAATGQGAHDDSTQPEGSTRMIDSGNADAPGTLDETLTGARVDHLNVADTGTGANTYTDRGAEEAQDAIHRFGSTVSATKAPVGGEIAADLVITTAWGHPYTCEIDFGDGTGTSSCHARHAYTETGTYPITFTGTTTSGIVKTYRHEITIVPPGGSLRATMTARHLGALTGAFDVVVSDENPWSIKKVLLGFGGANGKRIRPNEYEFSEAGTYTVTATVLDDGGNRTTATVTHATVASGYVPFAPTRFLDTRSGSGATGTLPPRGTLRLPVAGRDGIPADATAVVLNLTVAQAAASGYVTAYPAGTSRPLASTVNFVAGQVVPNLAVVPIGADGSVEVYNGSPGGTDLVADVTGYFTKDGDGVGFANEKFPQRLFDSRADHPGTVSDGQTISLKVTSDYDAVPVDATAVMLNVTAVDSRADGYLTVFPTGTPRPVASNLNYTRGRTVANTVTVPIGADGKVDFYAQNTTDLVVDVIGYFGGVGAQAYYVPVTPHRKVDTRTENRPLPGRGARVYTLAEAAEGFNSRAIGVMQNVTAVNAQRSGHLLAYSAAKPNPKTSTLNYQPGVPVSNLTATWYHQGAYYNGGDTAVDVVADVSGYFYLR